MRASRVLWVLLAAWIAAAPAVEAGTTREEQRRFNRTISDLRSRVNPRFAKVPRRSTQLIIVHTSEGTLRNTLRVVTEGKRVRGGRWTRGGHAHYVIGRDGRTYRTLDKRYRADHAGRSMWNGRSNLSDVSIGIELVGYHHLPITTAQYRSLELLLDILQRIYGLNDRAVLTHSQVAYGGPNPWFRRDHRGRKRCAKGFDRERAGLGPTWSYDPDVRAGRLLPDRELAAIFYGPKKAAPATESHVITANRTAWMIAGEDYDASSTLYRLPSGTVVPGDEMRQRVGWKRVPRGTRVTVAAAASPGTSNDVVRVMQGGGSAWALTGGMHQRKTTHYLFPNGDLKNGAQISDWRGLPDRTRVIVGYSGPFAVTASRPPIVAAGRQYRDRRTLYLFPDSSLVPGAEIRDFKRLPAGVRVFVPSS